MKCFSCKTGELIAVYQLGFSAHCCDLCHTIYSSKEVVTGYNLAEGEKLPLPLWEKNLKDDARESIIAYAKGQKGE